MVLAFHSLVKTFTAELSAARIYTRLVVGLKKAIPRSNCWNVKATCCCTAGQSPAGTGVKNHGFGHVTVIGKVRSTVALPRIAISLNVCVAPLEALMVNVR